MTEPIDPALFRDAMRRTAASVAVVTTDGPAGMAGLTVSSLCSLSMEPPALIFCVNRTSRSLLSLMVNGVFAANFLCDDQARVAEVFAGLVPDYAENRFAAGSWTSLATGSPVLTGALCSFDCRIVRTIDINTHCIVIGEVTDLVTAKSDPLVFSDRKYWKLENA